MQGCWYCNNVCVSVCVCEHALSVCVCLWARGECHRMRAGLWRTLLLLLQLMMRSSWKKLKDTDTCYEHELLSHRSANLLLCSSPCLSFCVIFLNHKLVLIDWIIDYFSFVVFEIIFNFSGYTVRFWVFFIYVILCCVLLCVCFTGFTCVFSTHYMRARTYVFVRVETTFRLQPACVRCSVSRSGSTAPVLCPHSRQHTQHIRIYTYMCTWRVCVLCWVTVLSLLTF